MNKKYVSLFSSVCVLSTLAVTYTQCGKSAHIMGSSKEEINALQKPIFTFPDNQGPGTDIVDDDDSDPSNPSDPSDPDNDTSDSYIPGNPYKTDDEPFKWVTSCNELESSPTTRETYIQNVQGETGIVPGVAPHENITTSRDFELAVVNKIVEDRIKEIKAGKQVPLLIPVEYTFSTGDKHDKISYMAYRRSILRNDSNGKSYLPTAKHTYVVDHEVARSHFIEGRFKYYSYVEVKEKRKRDQSAFTDFVQGQPFDSYSAFNMHLLGGGLKDVGDYITHYETKKELPLGRIYLADVRDDIASTKIKVDGMYPDVASGGRNKEVSRRLKDIFNMKNFFQKSNYLTHAYSVDRKINAKKYEGLYASYAGMPQLLHKMNCDVGSTSIIATQYTPIVLDLGRPYIRTSSEHWGTFFNLANAQIVKDGQPVEASGENTYSHKTAWIGGYLKKVTNPVLDALPAQDTIVPFKEVWQRVAEDGFLILPPAEGKPVTAENLFGAAFKNPEKPEAKYENGFLALQDFSGTAEGCSSSMPSMSYSGEAPTDELLNARFDEIKKRYLGPWNEKFYQLKVWVDADRDGVAQPTEVKNLLEAGVLAMNTCLIASNSTAETDKFGNNTKLRSAFLYSASSLPGAVASEDEIKEILRTLALGKGSNGQSGNFRLMVDIFFKARPFHFLERSLKYRESNDNKKYQVMINGNLYNEDDSDVPLEFR